MRIDPIVDKRGRWRFKIVDDNGKTVIPIPVSGYKTRDEALAAANALVNSRADECRKKAKDDLETIQKLSTDLKHARSVAKEKIGALHAAGKRGTRWLIVALVSWVVTAGVLIHTYGG